MQTGAEFHKSGRDRYRSNRIRSKKTKTNVDSAKLVGESDIYYSGVMI